MSYYKILGFEKEPFSTSPDPAFFFESKEHRVAILQLIIEIRLKRGLSVILGDVGTGKTTLSRKLFQMLKEREDIIFHMLLDPTFDTEETFLDSLVRTLRIELPSGHLSILDYKEAIKKYLFQKAVEENKTVVLLIDEAQKLNSSSLEHLRVLLNYETNEFKLLQLVLLGQIELLPKIREMKNLWDRVSLKYVLNPLSEGEMKEMVNFRLTAAGYRGLPEFFTDEAIAAVFRYTQGYPRRISMICHNALKELVLQNKTMVDAGIVLELIDKDAKVNSY